MHRLNSILAMIVFCVPFANAAESGDPVFTKKQNTVAPSMQLRGPVKLLATLCFGLATLGQANAKCYSVEGSVMPSRCSVTVLTPLCHAEPDRMIEQNIKRATVRKHPMMREATIDIASRYVECPQTCLNSSRDVRLEHVQFSPKP